MSTAAQLLHAKLCGTARRLSISKTPIEEAVAELQAISADPVALGTAAGLFMAGHRHDAHINPFDRHAADLLLAAGGDLEAAELYAAEVARNLSGR